MVNYPKITVVTPNFNQGNFIERTIRSVLDQQYPNLDYIIIDGASTDDSVAIIKKYEASLSYWVSEKDSGMYEAINKGFERSTGDLMCWINSDDVLLDRALFRVAAVFLANKEVQWVQGKPTVVDEEGKVLKHPRVVASPYHFYFRRHQENFSFIQQESTFWRRELWEKAGSQLSAGYRLAADFDLWMRFFQYESLYVLDEPLGAFRKREGQLSSNTGPYLKEAAQALKKHLKALPKSQRWSIFVNRLRYQILSLGPFTVCKKRRNRLLKKLLVVYYLERN